MPAFKNAALRLGWISAFQVWVALASPQLLCVAEDAPADSVEYGKLIDEALVEYREGHFSEARALFWRAHSLAPSARTLRGIGMAEFELRNYTESVRQLKRALTAEVRALDGELRAETQQLLARALQFVARIGLQSRPTGATVLVDGAELALDGDSQLLLGAGRHVLELRADGFQPQQRTLDVHGGEREQLTIVLEPELFQTAPAPQLPAAALQPSAPLAERDESSPWYTSPWLWAGVGAVVVGAGVGVGLAVANGGSSPKYYGGDTNTLLTGP